MSETKYSLRWEESEEKPLHIDFKDVVDRFKQLSPGSEMKNIAFLHWQARPRGLRQWGILYYNWEGVTRYLSGVAGEIIFEHLLAPSKLIDVPENIAKSPPTAVICYTDVQVIRDNSGKILVMGK